MIETWMKLANVARMTRYIINTTGLCKNDLPPDCLSFVKSQLFKIDELERIERKWLAEADTMPIQRLRILTDEMWSGWVRAKLSDVLFSRGGCRAWHLKEP